MFEMCFCFVIATEKSKCVLKLRFTSGFICFIFAFSGHCFLSLNLYFLKLRSVPMWSADAFLQGDRFVLTSVKVMEWNHKEWTLIFEANSRLLF